MRAARSIARRARLRHPSGGIRLTGAGLAERLDGQLRISDLAEAAAAARGTICNNVESIGDTSGVRIRACAG